jgi:hypothetical protein
MIHAHRFMAVYGYRKMFAQLNVRAGRASGVTRCCT